jgi:cytochrome c553
MNKLVLILILSIPLILHAHKASINTALCAACHGSQGTSINLQWPNIAGQYPKYFIKQLKDMRNPSLRNAPTMNALVTTLSEKDIDELAVYYGKMPLAQGSMPEHGSMRGEQIYRAGDVTKGITACIACHGPKGTGNAQAGFPILSGQHAAYTILQLNAFKEGKRANDLNHIMRDISSRMSQDDMEAVAYYIEGLH